MIYRNDSGEAVALDNACPHRGAPLHLGKLIGDKIECSYHGMQFASDGMCILNPHSKGNIPSRMRTHRYPKAIDDVSNLPFPSNAGPARVRKLLRELISAQAADEGGLPDPRNQALEKLVEEARYTHGIEPAV